ncbi:MAG: DUF1080 domain-containing protein [Actinomycetota bacterium]|nr:DUF1080 domain-containing protein [Actinomycetota bacterium]
MKLAWKTPIIAKATAAVILPFTTAVAAHTAGTNITSTTSPSQSVIINGNPIVYPTSASTSSTALGTTQTSNPVASLISQSVVSSTTTSQIATTTSATRSQQGTTSTIKANPSFIAGSTSAVPAPVSQNPPTTVAPVITQPPTTVAAPTTIAPAPQLGFGTLGFSSFAQGTPSAMGQAYGSWMPIFNGYGNIERVNDPVLGDSLNLTPATSTNSSSTHSALVTTTNSYGDFNATFTYRTVSQLRTGSSPNPWEVGWVLFHYSDNTHFYYFLAKPTGWELGKEDPSYPGNQRFMVTGSTPFPVGNTYTINVVMKGATISVTVNGSPIVTYTDTQSPYTNGSLALYDEDSSVDYAPVVVN